MFLKQYFCAKQIWHHLRPALSFLYKEQSTPLPIIQEFPAREDFYYTGSEYAERYCELFCIL